MKRRCFLVLVMFVALAGRPAAAQSNNTNVVVRDTNGLSGIQNSCLSVGCNVLGELDGNQGQLFLVAPTQTSSSGDGGGGGGGGLLGGGLLGGLVNTAFDLLDFIAKLLLQPVVTNAEPDQLLMVGMTLTAPSGLWDTTPVNYYGNIVWDGYVHQPATFIIELPETRSIFRVTGSGTVAVIDTGIDPTHPAFKGVLVPGYDFTRNTAGGSELGDVQQSTMAVVNGGGIYPAQVNQSTMAVVNPWDATTFQSSQYAAFGHGTMTSGIVHLVAPTAKIMPLKAFRSDGTGYLSDILRATYYAVQHSTNVINMSFDFLTYSLEAKRAVSYANRAGVICVASAGNDGLDELAYPAAYTSVVMGVASTNDYDQRSSFSNYGQDLVWVAAPGEAIISPYPYGTYAAGWGTSFSAPFVSGAAALLRSVNPGTNQYGASQALAHAQYISPELNHGRIDLYQAVSSMYGAVQTIP